MNTKYNFSRKDVNKVPCNSREKQKEKLQLVFHNNTENGEKKYKAIGATFHGGFNISRKIDLTKANIKVSVIKLDGFIVRNRLLVQIELKRVKGRKTNRGRSLIILKNLKHF